MRLRDALTLAGAAAATACAAPVADPKPPAILVQHDEAPYGDTVNHRRVQAFISSLDKLEPQWGKLKVEDYTIAPPDDAKLWPAVEAAIPKGWAPVALGGFRPRHGELRAWSAGKQFYAVLRVDPGIPSDIPVLVLRDTTPRR